MYLNTRNYFLFLILHLVLKDKDIFDSRMGLRNQNPSMCKEQMVKGTLLPGAVTVSVILSVSVMGIEMQALAINDC